MSAWIILKIDQQASTNIGLINTRISQHISTHAMHFIDNSKYSSDKYTLEVCEAGEGGRGSAFCDKSQMLLSRATAAPKLITLNLPKICKPQRSHSELVTKKHVNFRNVTLCLSQKFPESDPRVWHRRYISLDLVYRICLRQGGITCGTIDEPRKSSKGIDERIIIDFRDKNVVIARFRDQNEVFI